MCGIFGIDGDPGMEEAAAKMAYLGLYALQHRGQESTGIVSWDGSQLHLKRGMGEVADIFKQEDLARLPGYRAAGHTRYSTAGSSAVTNAQPIVVKTSMGPLAIIHNGNLVNDRRLRSDLEADGSIFQTTSDTEVILHLMARNPRADVVESLMTALARVQGAYSLLLVSSQGLIAARDPNGFRPLAIGRQEGTGAACFASETCAFDLLGAVLERELEPGEVVVSRGGELESYRLPVVPEPSRCAFEHVYFARPDSNIFGREVAAARKMMGAALARSAPVPADVVVPVPDSGVFAALGYARESGLPFEFGLIRNHYVGRTFIQPGQSIRDFSVKVKLNPVRGLIEGRRVILLDDSIVRGTTSRKIVRIVREAGAREVHMRISSPPTAYPCHYGINTPRREELIASAHDVEAICEHIGADSLAYLSLDEVLSSLGGAKESYCAACWSGSYPLRVDARNSAQQELFPIRSADDPGL
ncbi:MAG: amidophosphoribosyltransferase [Acidobacteriota bacterium]